MFDVFNNEIEVLIKQGLSNLYWFKGDLKKAWLQAGVDKSVMEKLFSKVNQEGKPLTKRELMDCLYIEFREADFNRRLEISRNFVRFLAEHKNFVPHDANHRIEIAERCALKLKEIIEKQRKEQDQMHLQKKTNSKKIDYYDELSKLRDHFIETQKMEAQRRGYELQNIFSDLMKISGIPVENSFRIIGEQIDGAIKHEGHYYLVELKYKKDKSDHNDLSSLYYKVDGKLEARGIFIAMNGYSEESIKSFPKGKKIKVLLFDGVHLANVIEGCHTFQKLLDCAIKEASLKGNIFCPHNLEI